MNTRTPDQVKAEFEAQGITITDWARKNKFPPREVILVLNGYYQCKRGRAHRIAVALGIKAEPKVLSSQNAA